MNIQDSVHNFSYNIESRHDYLQSIAFICTKSGKMAVKRARAVDEKGDGTQGGDFI